MYAYLCAYLCVYVYLCIVYISVCVRILCGGTSVCICVYVYLCVVYVFVCTCICVYLCVCAHVYAFPDHGMALRGGGHGRSAGKAEGEVLRPGRAPYDSRPGPLVP